MTKRKPKSGSPRQLLDAVFAQSGAVIDIKAKILEGWEKKKKTYGFVAWEWLDWKHDIRLRVQVQVLARPAALAESYRDFPEDLEWEKSEIQDVSYSLHNGTLNLMIRLLESDGFLNKGLPWKLTTSDNLATFWQQHIWGRHEGPNYGVQLLAVFHLPRTRRPRDVKDWQRFFAPGGLPSLGKRK